MVRSRNLDTIAPDDPITLPPTPVKRPESEPEPVVASTLLQTSDTILDKIYQILGHSKSPLSSALVNPKVFDFEERDEDEKIYLVLRPHWVTNVRWILITIFMLFIPLVLTFFPLLAFFPANYQFVFVVMWYVITFVIAFESFLSWYFDVYIVTSERLIDIEFNNLLNKKFSEARLEMIQDVTYTVTGMAETMFNYGDVLVQTASEIPEIDFENVPNPGKVIKVIQQLRDALGESA